MNPLPHTAGWIEVVTGCMFSGKTEELIRRLIRARIARQDVMVFKPSVDTRYAKYDIVSHAGHRLPCTAVPKASDIARLRGEEQVIGIDEAQFFGPELVEIVDALANDGCRVIVAGLDQDFLGRPFEPMPALLAIAEYITKNLAVCMVCGAPADKSQRLVNREDQVVLGATETYEARCRSCWKPHHNDPEQGHLPLAEER